MALCASPWRRPATFCHSLFGRFWLKKLKAFGWTSLWVYQRSGGLVHANCIQLQCTQPGWKVGMQISQDQHGWQECPKWNHGFCPAMRLGVPMSQGQQFQPSMKHVWMCFLCAFCLLERDMTLSIWLSHLLLVNVHGRVQNLEAKVFWTRPGRWGGCVGPDLEL